MRHLMICLLLLFPLSSALMAHPDAGDHHHHEPAAIEASEAQDLAKKVVAKKVEEGKLAATWLKVPAAKPYQKSFGHGPEWVVEFNDPKAKEKGKETVFVFLSLGGKALGVNFTGR